MFVLMKMSLEKDKEDVLMSFRLRSTNITSSFVSFNAIFYDEPT